MRFNQKLCMLIGLGLTFAPAAMADEKPPAEKAKHRHIDGGDIAVGAGIGAVLGGIIGHEAAAEGKEEAGAIIGAATGMALGALMASELSNGYGGRFDSYGYQQDFKGYYPYEQPSHYSVGYSSGYGDGSASHDYGSYGYNDALYEQVLQHQREQRQQRRTGFGVNERRKRQN